MSAAFMGLLGPANAGAHPRALARRVERIVGFAVAARSNICVQAPSYAREVDSSRWAWAWASSVLAWVSNVCTASAPAAKRVGGSGATGRLLADDRGDRILERPNSGRAAGPGRGRRYSFVAGPQSSTTPLRRISSMKTFLPLLCFKTGKS